MGTQSLRTIGFLVFMAAPSFAQVDSALGFFPLHIGDSWQYHYHYNSGYQSDSVSTYFVTSISGDTLMPNGRRYEVFNNGGPDTPSVVCLRVDSSDACVFRYDQSAAPSSEKRVDSLAAREGDFLSHDGGSSLYCLNFDTMSVLGSHTVAKRFTSWILPSFTYTFAHGFGLVHRIDPGEAPSWVFPIFTDIVFARINGVEHGVPVSVRTGKQMKPPGFSLGPNFPNPFNGTTTIDFSLEQSGDISLQIFNILGERVATLLAAHLGAGEHVVRWTPDRLASGVYLCRLISDRQVLNQRVVYVR